MTSAVISKRRWATEQRLSLSVLVSALVHVLAIVMLASLLSEWAPPPSLSGAAAPSIDVAIVAARPIAFAAPPEEPVLLAESLAPAEPLPGESPARATSSPAPDLAREPESGAIKGATRSAEETITDALSDLPVPPGDVAVGAVDGSERLGTAPALRLAQRFRSSVNRPPRLRDPIVVVYPTRAARAHREARIAALLIVDAEGKIIETTLFPDDPWFAPTINEALKGIRLSPAAVESGPASYWTILEFVFTMRHEPAPRTATGDRSDRTN